jgi:hypothetical protein
MGVQGQLALLRSEACTPRGNSNISEVFLNSLNFPVSVVGLNFRILF